MMATDHSALEVLFWQIMRRFEHVAVEQYRRHVPALATAEKSALVGTLDDIGAGDDALAASELAAPLQRLLGAALGDGPVPTLVVQGLVLEQLGQAIYGAVSTNANVSARGREVAAAASAASRSVTEQVPGLFTAAVPADDERFPVFAETSHDLLLELDGLGGGIDRTFGPAFQLQFKDIAGEFVARAVPVCTTLGMKRRQVVSHLAGALMGF